MGTIHPNLPKKKSPKTSTDSQPDSPESSSRPEDSVTDDPSSYSSAEPGEPSITPETESPEPVSHTTDTSPQEEIGSTSSAASESDTSAPTETPAAQASVDTATADVNLDEFPPVPRAGTESKSSGGGGGKPPAGGGRGDSGRGGGLLGGQMSFLEHLEELRQRLLYSVLSLVVAFFFCFYFHEQIYDFLAAPITGSLRDLDLGDKLVYTNPMQPFNVYLKISLVASLFLASPLILWQLWLFISPGLYRHEKKYVLPFVTLTTLLFLSGGYFAYRVALPPVFQFLLKFGHKFLPFITINEYFSITTTLLVGMGLVFEIPIVVLILSLFGMVTPKFLLKNIRYAVLIIAILAAALAPTPDWMTLMLFSLPMVGLYFLSIGLCYLVQLRKKSSQAAD